MNRHAGNYRTELRNEMRGGKGVYAVYGGGRNFFAVFYCYGMNYSFHFALTKIYCPKAKKILPSRQYLYMNIFQVL